MRKWNQVNKRLKTIIADGLDVAFNFAVLRAPTDYSEINLPHFHIKFNKQILWNSQKDSAYFNVFYGAKFILHPNWNFVSEGNKNTEHSFLANPQNIIAEYLDTPKDKLFDFQEPTGLKYILWACDKRIGKNKLLQTDFTEFALPIVKQRVPEYDRKPIIFQAGKIVYTSEDFTIFDFSGLNDCCYGSFKTIVIADNINYSKAQKAEYITCKGVLKKAYSKKKLNLPEEHLTFAKNLIDEYMNENYKDLVQKNKRLGDFLVN